MRLEQLEYFSSLAKYRSITAASEMLFITPQALSASIKNLENELNVELITKNYSGISLTPEGKELLATVNQILALSKNLYKYADTVTQNISGDIRLYSTPLISNLLIYSTLAPFYTKYPDININIHEHRVSDYLDNLDKYSFDFAFIHIPNDYLPDFNARYGMAYDISVLLEDKLAFSFNKEHPLAQKRNISYKTALDYPFVLLHDKDLFYDFNLDEAVEKYGFPENYSCFSNIFYCINALKSNPHNIGISLKKVNSFITASQSTQDLVTIPLRDSKDVSILLIMPKDKPLTPAIETTMDYFKKTIRK